MKSSLQCFSFVLSLSLLASCNGLGVSLNCDGDDQAGQQAAGAGDLEELKRLVATGRIYGNARCEDHDTMLLEAVKNGHLEVVRYLVETLRVDVNIPEKVSLFSPRHTPLHYAAENGHTEIARLLLENNAQVDSKNNYDETPLHLAARYGHTDIARLLLENNAQVDSKNNWGWNPLHLAAEYGHTETARLLLDRGAEVNCRSNDGDIPLHCAAKKNRKQVAYLLIERGADLDIRNDEGHKPLDPANSKFSPKETFLLVAAAGRETLVEDILDNNRGLDINTKDENGDTALILAARNGHLSVVEVLIGRGANRNRQNNDKQTALETSIRNRRRTVTLELINNNDQSLNALNSERQTALMVAIEMGQEEVAFALIEAGANLNRKDNKKWPALKYARKGNHKEIAKELFRKGAEEYDPVKIAATVAKVVAVEVTKTAVDKI